MKKWKALIIMTCLFSGCSSGQIKDEGGMTNPYADTLDAISGSYENKEENWSAEIDGYSLKLTYGSSVVFDETYNLPNGNTDADGKIEMELYNSEGKDGSTVKQIYYDNGCLYMDILDSNNERKTIAMNRTE